MRLASRFSLLIIIICLLSMVFSGCATTAVVQGVKVKDPNTFKQSQKDHNIMLLTFLVSTALVGHFYNPDKK